MVTVHGYKRLHFEKTIIKIATKTTTRGVLPFTENLSQFLDKFSDILRHYFIKL